MLLENLLVVVGLSIMASVLSLRMDILTLAWKLELDSAAAISTVIEPTGGRVTATDIVLLTY